MSERKKQILQAAIDIITGQGYGALTMRALARASGIKLGALQYHFKTRDDMLRALVGYIAEEYQNKIMLFKTNYRDLAEARKDVDLLSGLIDKIGR